MVQAVLDPAFGTRLLADPRQAALDAQCSPILAESLVGLRAGSLPEFAAALHTRIHGYPPAQPYVLPTIQHAAYAQ